MSQRVIQQAGRRLGRLLRPTRALCRFFLPGAENVTVEAYGNGLVAVAFLLGLAAQDLPPKKRDVYGPHYQCLIAVRAQKAPLS